MKKNKPLLFKQLSSETELILMENLHFFKGGGDSDTLDGGDLEEVTITPDQPEDDEEIPEPDPIEDDWDDEPEDEWNEEDWWNDEGDHDGSQDPEENEDRPDPCNPAAIAANTSTSNLFKKTAVQSQVGNFSAITSTSAEQGFSIRKLADGTFQATAIQTMGPTGGSITNFGNSVADVHTHPSSNAPSAQDILGLGHINGVSANFTTRYVKTADGDMYALNVSDAAKLKDFYDTFKDDLGSDNMFKSDSEIGAKFETVRQSFISSGASAESAYDHATAFLLNDAGVTLLKAPNGSNDFTKIGAEIKTDTSGNPVLDANNQPTYETSDCPRN